MKRLSTAVASVVVAAVCLTGPAVAAPTPPAVVPASISTPAAAADGSLSGKVEAVLARSALPAQMKARVRALVAALPADAAQRAAKATDRLHLDSRPHEVLRSAIDPSQYTCQSTPLTEWAQSQVVGADETILMILSFIAGDQLPTFEALFNGVESKQNRFGLQGQYTQLLTSEMKDLRRFWDVDGERVRLVPMKSDIYDDLGRMTRLYSQILGVDRDEAAEFAGAVQELLAMDPVLQNGHNPIFTFNAFALDPGADPELSELGVTPVVAVGDAILQGNEAIGAPDKIAPRAILAHEYGHIVQFAKDQFDAGLPTEAEATRRTELMADAFATYFLVHPRGESLNTARTLDTLTVFYNVGDCGFDSDGHHGTPSQRLAAGRWAADLVPAADKRGHKIGAVDLGLMFDRQLPSLVAPDRR